MVLSFAFSAFVFENVLELQDKKFDFVSFAESIFAFGGITLGIGNISSFGLVSTQAGIPLLIGIIVCILFIMRQCSLEKPFLDVKILRNRNYAVSVISSMVLYLVMMGSSVMMPLLTWGTSNVNLKKVADASSLLTSLRTIAGSIGSAVFVGIMMMVSESSAPVYGDYALMHGMNMSFFWMAAGALVLFLISVFGVKSNSAKSNRNK